MNPVSMKDQLSALMISHDVPFHIEEDWIVPFGQLPAIRAIWYPREQSGVLEVEVLLAQNQVITECFAGFGTGNDAISDAIQNFQLRMNLVGGVPAKAKPAFWAGSAWGRSGSVASVANGTTVGTRPIALASS